MSHHQSHSCCSKNECGCSSHSSLCGCGSHHYQQSCNCSACGSNCECKSHSCGCGCKQCGSNYTSKFLELADCAWMEVLKEKIKEHIRSNAHNMDELARLISEANHEKWRKKMENNKCSDGFEEKLNDFFGLSCSTHSHQQENQNNLQGNQNKQH